MGVVNTTYTFLGTDTITSAKLNNIIDDTTFTSDAIQGTTLQVVSPGKLAVSAGGITSNEMAANSVVTAAIADSNVTTAKIADSNVTQAKLAANVVGNGPAFSAYPSTDQAVATASGIRVVLGSESFDTNSNFASSRFTPSVAGYYFFHGVITMTVGDAEDLWALVYKNGFPSAEGARINGQSYSASVSGLIYMNGSTDYAELYVRHLTGSNRTILAGGTVFQGCLVRSA
jgi:hypothetical protein